MFVAIRDLRFAKGRFALMASVVALLTMLMVLLTGLASGLVDDNISAIRDMPADSLSFDAESGVKFNQSVVTRTQWDELRRQPGVTAAAPVGNTLFNGHAYSDAGAADAAAKEVAARGKAATATGGTPVDLALFGVEPGSFVAPEAIRGSALSAGRADGAVISESLARKQNLQVGDSLVLDRAGTKLTVVGVTHKANYGHVPVVYVPLATWQQASFAGRDGAAPQDLATFVALDTSDGFSPATLDPTLKLRTVSLEQSFDGSPGYKEETGTLTMIKCFLYLIGAMLVGAFFMVWTIQRTGEIGLLKALGASNAYLLRDALGQALLVLTGSAVIGVLAGRVLGLAIPNGAPFAFVPGPILAAGLFVVVLGLLGATLSIRRITKVDPLIALGGAR